VNGGIVNITSGAGDDNNAGGEIDLTAGNGGLTGAGGTIDINAGSSGATSGVGGAVTITAGLGENLGGTVLIVGGYAGEYTAVNGGQVILRGGASGYGGTGTGGSVSIVGGLGYSYLGSNTPGGAVIVTGGEGGGDADGGSVILRGGAAASYNGGTNGDGGDIIIDPTVGKGTGIDGAVILRLSAKEFGKTRGGPDVSTTNADDTLLISEAVASGSATGFEAYIVGHQVATGDSVYAHITGLIKNVSGTTAIVGTNTTVRKEDAGATTWTLEVVANNTDDTLEVRVTGEAAHTIEWTGRVTMITN